MPIGILAETNLNNLKRSLVRDNTLTDKDNTTKIH